MSKYRDVAIAKSLAAGDRSMFDAKIAEECERHPALSREAVERRLLTDGDLYAHYTQAVLAGVPLASSRVTKQAPAPNPRAALDAELSRRIAALEARGLSWDAAVQAVFAADPAFYQAWRANIPGAPTIELGQPQAYATPGLQAPPPDDRRGSA